VNNPSAFPRATVNDNLGKGAQQPGMTLRDYFAAAAMASLLRHPEAVAMLNGAPEFSLQENTAEASYKVADAMLAERERETLPRA
jgi:hypothetical protein